MTRDTCRRVALGVLASAALALLACQAASTPPSPVSVAARPMAVRLGDLTGLENVGRITPGLYRGAQPTMEGLDSLRSLGIKTVVNLRHYHGAREERACLERGLGYVRIGLPSSDAPRDEDVRLFLEVATDPRRQPVYVHCWRGKDRTGVMCAVYRLAVEGWSLEEALAEMDSFGFYAGWHDLREYVRAFPARQAQLWPLRGIPVHRASPGSAP